MKNEIQWYMLGYFQLSLAHEVKNVHGQILSLNDHGPLPPPELAHFTLPLTGYSLGFGNCLT